MSIDPDRPSAPLADTAAVPLTAQPIRFCRTCGAPWEPSWDQCPHCAAQQPQPQVELAYRQERRFVISSVQLYFALLAVSMVALMVGIAQEKPPTVIGEFVIEGAMSLITLAWCLRLRSELAPILRTSAPPR